MLPSNLPVEFVRFQNVHYNKGSAANTAVSSDLTEVIVKLGLLPNQIAVLERGLIRLVVSGGNADGDDLFQMLLGIRKIKQVRQMVWRETIAQASLTQNSIHDRYPPLDDTTMGNINIFAFEDERIYWSSTAGGANVIYTVDFWTTWAVYDLLCKAAVIRKW